MKLKFINNCPLCGHKYDTSYFKVIDKKDGIMTLYLDCPFCQSSVMIALTINAMGMTSVSMITDVTEKEIDSLRGKRAISADEVLEFHSFLASPKKAQKKN